MGEAGSLARQNGSAVTLISQPIHCQSKRLMGELGLNYCGRGCSEDRGGGVLNPWWVFNEAFSVLKK